MKILITGATGFVGRHLVARLQETGVGTSELFATAMSAFEDPQLGIVRALDVTDKAAVELLISGVNPTHVVNLAGLAATAHASANAWLAWQVHLFGALNVGHAILNHAPRCVMINISSGQVYGGSGQAGRSMDEATLLVPTNCYEVTKAAADLAIGALTLKGLASIRFRPFNHSGPGQTEDFVMPSFAMQIARIEAGLQAPVVRVGNLDAERDFLDVRDVAEAYALGLAKSADIAPGTILNVASGVPRRIQSVLDGLIALSRVPITIETDPARMRPSETPRFVGDASLAKRLLGWSPALAFEATLAEVLDNCRARVAAGLPT